MNLIAEYIKYRWKAKRRHGVHSPFIYDLTDKCFRTPVNSKFEEQLDFLNKKLESSNESISITDFGAGSKKLGAQRRVRDIYKTSSSKGIYGKRLHQLVAHYKPANILEFGTSLGIGTSAMASGNPQTKVTTVEGCPNTHKLATASLKELKTTNVSAINSTFDEFIGTLTNEIFDIIFIDGHHDGDALLKYVAALQKHATDQTLFILDDIRWSTSMKSAWDALVETEQWHVTIDLFRMGILVRRPEQVKEHFTIR